MIRERIEHRQQQRQRHHVAGDEKFRQPVDVVFDDLSARQFGLLQIGDVARQVERDERDGKPDETVRERQKQFAQEVSVEQSH
jgi:hypothetical protein